MKIEWMKALMLLDEKVDRLVDETGDKNSNNYQMKIDFWKSIARRRFQGEVRHLPTKRTARFSIELPL